MPQYLFTIEDGHSLRVEVDLELNGPDHARHEAVRAAAEALRDLGGCFWGVPHWTMQVTDTQGGAICEIGIMGRLHGI